MELLARLSNSVHLVISVTARSANANQVLLVDLMGDFRQLALFAADILHDKLVKVASQIGCGVLSFDNRGALRVRTHLTSEVLEDGAFRHA